MTGPGDDVGEMGTTELPDEAIESFLLGDTHGAWEQDAALAMLAEQVLIGATGPAPRPSPALSAFLGRPSGSPATGHAHNVVPLFRRLRLTAGIAAAAGVAAAALTVAGTTGVLPDPAMRAVSWVIEAVTPFDLPGPSGSDPVAEPGPMSTVPPSTAGPSAIGQDGPPGLPAATPLGARPGAQLGVPAVGGTPGPGKPATAPASVPAGTSGPNRPSGTGGDQGQIPPAAFSPLAPSPQAGISPPAGGSVDSPSTTVVDRPRQAPSGEAVRPSVAGSPPQR